MRKVLCITLLLVLDVASSCPARKVTTDPNARPTQSQAATPEPQAGRYDPARDPDKRMAHEVSYEAHHGRLSAITSVLTQVSGVAIVCGKSRNDWQVRDIPVTVYARDLPLGVLLRGLARATHNVVKAERTSKTVAYRIYQDPKLTRQFEDYEKAKERHRQAMLAWSWDTMAGIKDIPDSEYKPHNSDPIAAADYTNAAKRLSALVAALGPDYRQRVLAGEVVTLDPKTVSSQIKGPLLGVLEGYDRMRLGTDTRSSRYQNPDDRMNIRAPMTSDELEKTKLTVWVRDSQSASIETTASSPIGFGLPVWPYTSFAIRHPDKFIKRAQPTPPRIIDGNPYDVDFIDLGGMVPEALQVKVDLDDLANKKVVKYPALIEEAAKRTGFSLVIEDWDYFRETPDYYPYYLKKGVELDSLYYCSCARYWPKVDLANKIIVPISMDWVEKHRALAPASVVDTLLSKLNGDGVDLEDLLPVMRLTQTQWDEWVHGSNDLSVLTQHSMETRDPLWQFFAALTPGDREMAAGTDGLGLGDFDPAVITDLLTQYCKFRDKQLVYLPNKPHCPSIPDEQGLARLVLRLKSNPSPYYSYTGPTVTIPMDKVAPRGLDKTCSYRIEIASTADDTQQLYASSDGPSQLPFYFKERDAELLKPFANKPNPK